MQDVSRVTGNPVTIHSQAKGRDFILRGMTFDDLGVLQRTFLRDKKRRLLEAAQLRAEMEPEGARAAVMDKAQADVAQIAFLSQDEFQAALQTPQGTVEFFWVLFQRQYPNEMSRQDILGVLQQGDLAADDVGSLVRELFGGPPEGNSTGQSNSAT